jgi:hypothetical protein
MVVTADFTEVTTRDRERLAAPHEYRLLDSPAGDELETVPARRAARAGRA